jgi:hypothetical protein
LDEKNCKLEASLAAEIGNGQKMKGLMEKTNENILRLNALGESKEDIISGILSQFFS